MIFGSASDCSSSTMMTWRTTWRTSTVTDAFLSSMIATCFELPDIKEFSRNSSIFSAEAVDISTASSALQLRMRCRTVGQ